MKTLVLVACLLSSSVYAQAFTVKKSIDCANRDAVLASVLKTHGHVPVWSGVQDKFGFLLTENKKTGEWVMIQYDNEFACILAEGTKAKPLFIGQNAV